MNHPQRLFFRLGLAALCVLPACTAGPDPGDSAPLADSGVASADSGDSGLEDTGTGGGLQFAPVVETYEVETTSFEGFEVVQHLPSDPSAVAFLFHGTGGSAQMARKVEVVDLLNDLVAAGVGFVATESTDRDDLLKWDKDDIDPESNADLGRLFRLREQLLEQQVMDEQTPVLALGTSNGASFCAVFGHAAWRASWPVAALDLHIGPVPSAVDSDGGLQLATTFVVAANDDTVDNDRIRSDCDAMEAGGVDVDWHEVQEFALSPERFMRVPGVSEELSREVFDALADAGFVDADGVRLISLAEAEASLAKIELPEEASAYSNELLSQLKVVWAAHEFAATYKEDEAAFLLSAAGI